MHTSKRLCLLAMLASLLVAIAGCGADGAVKAPAAFDVFVDSPAVLAPVALSAEPAWGSEQVPVKHVSDVQFRGETAIVTGSAESNSSTAFVTAVDAVTGSVTWSIKTLEDLPGGDGAVLWDSSAYVAGTADNWVVLVNYYSSDCTSGLCPPGTVDSTDEQGVAALSPVDGSVLWKVAGVPSVAEDSEQADELQDVSALLLTASDGVALMVVAPTDAVYGSKFDKPDKIEIIALNPLDGSTLWTTTGVWPRQIVGDVVLASVPPGALADGPGTLAALDTTSGKQLWTLADTYPQAGLVVASPGALVVRQVEKGKLTNFLIRMSDGSKIADISHTSTTCAADSAAEVIACSIDGDPGKMRLMTYRSGDAAIKVSKRSVPDEMITAVHNGYVFYGAYGADPSYGAADYAGNIVSTGLPGRAVAVTDKYAVFDTTKKANTDPGSFAVYGIVA
ncbi:PQQ-binding-like beta-propeller repeat protein [Antricoccus suffuscus]|uniref:outer membrane protein assembly factor BamB family protein n=1 Tax=Antricoccus suffuscus TaxID=1629062 RepID=UPI0011B250EF|nr:PQQ-binding-like beta-propeller repeat protein [Antricoccus suffuscus]